MKVTVIPIVVGALGTVTKGLVRGLGGLELRGRVETIQSTEVLRSPTISRRVLETWKNLLLRRLRGKPSVNAGVKISQKCKTKNKAKNYLDLTIQLDKVVKLLERFLNTWKADWGELKSSLLLSTMIFARILEICGDYCPADFCKNHLV